jgi:hypothetical protein
MKSKNSWIRRTQRVIRMVGELHHMGYQRLRVMPFEHPLAFRVAIAPAELFSTQNGACIVDLSSPLVIQYSSASENMYFDWQDAGQANARELALKFIERFPRIAAAGTGRDWDYAGWLVELLGHFERQPDRLPRVMFEYGPEPLTLRELPMIDYAFSTAAGSFPLPPPGSAPLTSDKPAAAEILRDTPIIG